MKKVFSFFRIRSIGDLITMLVFFVAGFILYTSFFGRDVDTYEEDRIIDSLSQVNDSLRIMIIVFNELNDSLESELALKDSSILSLETNQTETIKRYEEEKIQLRHFNADEHLDLFSRHTDVDTTKR